MRRTRILVAIPLLLIAVAGGCAAMVAGANFDRAVEAFERGDYRGTIAQLEPSLRKGPDSARGRALLGWSYYRLGDLARARAEFERSLRLDPRDPNAFYVHEGLGWIAYRSGEHDRALAAFTEALRLAPGYHNAHTGLGWTYLAKADLARAETHFKAAVAREPADADARRGLGFTAYRRGEWTTAIERFQSVLRDHEADTLTRSALGWAYYYKGDRGAARAVFEDVARREPAWADPLLGFAWLAEREGRATDARRFFKAAIDKSARYVASGAPGGNVRALLHGRPEWVDVWRDLGWGLYHQREFALAEAEFRALLGRHPRDADGLRGLAYTVYAGKRYREAIDLLERSLAARVPLPAVRERVEIPGAPGLHEIMSDATSTLGWAYYYSGDLAAARRLFREATAAHRDWADAWSGLGWTLAKSGEPAEAETAFRQSLAAQAGYPDAVAGLRSLGKRAP